ncbi:hypothetical protein TNCV_3336541 [Trichonephila clavipes]|nr:hypothetical protein TNCV_3336541 [Trichonephila clavipes]
MEALYTTDPPSAVTRCQCLLLSRLFYRYAERHFSEPNGGGRECFVRLTPPKIRTNASEQSMVHRGRGETLHCFSDYQKRDHQCSLVFSGAWTKGHF